MLESDVLSGPFFVFFIPVFYVFQGVELTNPMIVGPAIYYVVLSLACTLIIPECDKRLAHVFFQGSPSGIQDCIGIKAVCSMVPGASIGVNRSFLSQGVCVSSGDAYESSSCKIYRCLWCWGTLGQYSCRAQREHRRTGRQPDRHRELYVHPPSSSTEF